MSRLPFFAVLALLATPLSAAPPPELTVLRQQYEKVYAERVTTAHEASVTELNTRFTTALDNAATAAQQAGKLDDVLAIHDDKKRLAEKLPIPDDDEKTPEALKKLRAIYREQLKKLEDARLVTIATVLPAYQAKLQELETTLTKAGRIEEAKELRTYREGLAAGGAEAPPSAAAGTPTTAPAVAALPKVKGDDRKAAEWLIKVGGHFDIEERGKKSKPTKPEDLPKGKFVITSIGLNGRDSKEPITVDAFPSLAGLQQLTNFSTDYLLVTDADLSFLATCPALEAITIQREARITDAIVDHLIGLKSLRHFGVTDVTAFTGATLHKLAGTKSLTRLEFIGSGFDDAGAEAVSQLKQLDSLTLESARSVTDTGLTHLGKLPALRSLSLCGAGGSAEALAAAKLRLERLDFNKLSGKLPRETAPIIGPAYPGVTLIRLAQSEKLGAEDIAALSHFKSLHNFQPLAINDPAAWAGLAAIPSLESISIDRNPFSDAEVNHLLKVHSLTGITFGNVDVTDEGLIKLVALKKLKSLSLKPCPKVTEAGIAALKKKRPDIIIYR